ATATTSPPTIERHPRTADLPSLIAPKVARAKTAKGAPEGALAREAVGAGSGRLDLDLDVDPGRNLEPLERVDGLGRRVEDVEQTLVHPHLEVLTGVLVLVGRTDHRVAVVLRRQG